MSCADNGPGPKSVNSSKCTALNSALEAQKPMPTCMIFDGFNWPFTWVVFSAVSSVFINSGLRVRDTEIGPYKVRAYLLQLILLFRLLMYG
jgi:hypothetical protein